MRIKLGTIYCIYIDKKSRFIFELLTVVSGVGPAVSPYLFKIDRRWLISWRPQGLKLWHPAVSQAGPALILMILPR